MAVERTVVHGRQRVVKVVIILLYSRGRRGGGRGGRPRRVAQGQRPGRPSPLAVHYRVDTFSTRRTTIHSQYSKKHLRPMNKLL